MPRKKTTSRDDKPLDVVTTLGAIERLADMPDMIRQVSEGFARAQRAGVGLRLLTLMISDTTSLSKTDVRKVLEALPLLYDRYCEPRDPHGPPPAGPLEF